MNEKTRRIADYIFYIAVFIICSLIIYIFISECWKIYKDYKKNKVPTEILLRQLESREDCLINQGKNLRHLVI
jgi:hypothetical protein